MSATTLGPQVCKVLPKRKLKLRQKLLTVNDWVLKSLVVCMYHNVPYLLIARICSVFLFVLCVILKVLGTIELSLFNFGYSLSARKREKRAAAHLWYSVGILGAIIVFVFYFFGVISFFLHVFSTVNPPKCTSVNASVARYIVAVTEKYLQGQRTRTFSLELFWESIGNFAFPELEDLS